MTVIWTGRILSLTGNYISCHMLTSNFKFNRKEEKNVNIIEINWNEIL